MSKLNVEKFRKRIMEQRERLLADRQRLRDHADSAAGVSELVDFDVNHPGDQGTELFERGKDEALTANVDAQLAQIDDALAKIEAGTYGTCDRCGKPIAEARLEALPFVSLCISCQALQENI